jgi:hypothetical protein
VLKSLAPKGPKALDGARRSRPTEQQRIAACWPVCLPACLSAWLAGWLAGWFTS